MTICWWITFGGGGSSISTSLLLLLLLLLELEEELFLVNVTTGAGTTISLSLEEELDLEEEESFLWAISAVLAISTFGLEPLEEEEEVDEDEAECDLARVMMGGGAARTLSLDVEDPEEEVELLRWLSSIVILACACPSLMDTLLSLLLALVLLSLLTPAAVASMALPTANPASPTSLELMLEPLCLLSATLVSTALAAGSCILPP